MAEHYPRRPDGIWVSPFEEEASLQASQVKEVEQAKLKALGVPAHLARRILTIHQGFVHDAVVNYRTKHAIFPDPTGCFFPAGAPRRLQLPADPCFQVQYHRKVLLRLNQLHPSLWAGVAGQQFVYTWSGEKELEEQGAGASRAGAEAEPAKQGAVADLVFREHPTRRFVKFKPEAAQQSTAGPVQHAGFTVYDARYFNKPCSGYVVQGTGPGFQVTRFGQQQEPKAVERPQPATGNPAPTASVEAPEPTVAESEPVATTASVETERPPAVRSKVRQRSPSVRRPTVAQALREAAERSNPPTAPAVEEESTKVDTATASVEAGRPQAVIPRRRRPSPPGFPAPFSYKVGTERCWGAREKAKQWAAEQQEEEDDDVLQLHNDVVWGEGEL